ncbi:MAG: hypothetical protein QNK78_02410 [Crocinitomicaceae bacterium]|jgi:hypothetical protein
MILKRENINPLWTERRDGNPVRIFQPRPKINGFPNAMIMSVLLNSEYTRIDFSFTYDIYDIRVPVYVISPEIRLVTAAQRSTYTPERSFSLIRFENAPIWPKKYEAGSKNDRLYFTLYFAPLPLYTLEFDIIESDDEDDGPMMNYLEINLDKGERKWEIKNSEN